MTSLSLFSLSRFSSGDIDEGRLLHAAIHDKDYDDSAKLIKLNRSCEHNLAKYNY